MQNTKEGWTIRNQKYKTEKMKDEILDDNFSAKTNSGFGTEKLSKINTIKIYVNIRIKAIKTAKVTFFVMATFLLIFSSMEISLGGQIVFSGNEIEGFLKFAVYLLCGFGIKQNAKLALIIGFGFFILTQIYYASFDIGEIWSWLIFKVPIIYILVQGIAATIKLEKDAIELLALGVSKSEIALIKELKEIPLTT